MIDNNVFAMLENKPSQSKSGNSSSAEKSDKSESNEFSRYLDKPSEKIKDKPLSKGGTQKNEEFKSESKVGKTTRTEISSQDDENKVAKSKDENLETFETEAKNVQANVENVVEDEETRSTPALMSLLLQRAIKSNIEDSGENDKGLENAVSVIKAQTSALENLIKKAEADSQLAKDALQAQKLGDNKERLSPELIKLMSNSDKDVGDLNKLMNLNKLNGESSRQDVLSQMKLQSIDEVMALNEDKGDLIAKLFDKLDLDKTKGESMFQNRMNLDKALISSEVADTALAKLGAESIDRNILASAAANTERSSAVASTQQMKMSTPVSSSEWGAEFGKRIQMMMKSNIQHAEIRLDPPEMGRIHIKINISQDQANVSFSALNANVREAIESSMARLRDMLADTGMQLGDTDVGEQFQQQTNQSSDGQDQFSFQQNGDPDDEVESTDLPPPIIQQSIDGVIDYFA